MGELADKVVVITGSAFGIGRAIALQASAKGAKVVIADVPAEETAGKRTASECEAAGAPAAMYQPCDVSEGAQVAALMEAAAAAYGSIDVIYANAGVGGVGPGKWAHEVGDDDFAKTVAINLGGVFHAAKYGLPHLVKSQGVLINTGSTFGMVGSHYAPAYCASKGGVINLTRQLAVDYGPLGVRVVAVCPGYVSNWMGHSVGVGEVGDLPDVGARALAPDVSAEASQSRWETRAGAASQQPLVRMCSPDEIASVAIFLATPAASFMTGTIVPVDGGCTATFAGSEVQTGYTPDDYISPLAIDQVTNEVVVAEPVAGSSSAPRRPVWTPRSRM